MSKKETLYKKSSFATSNTLDIETSDEYKKLMKVNNIDPKTAKGMTTVKMIISNYLWWKDGGHIDDDSIDDYISTEEHEYFRIINND